MSVSVSAHVLLASGTKDQHSIPHPTNFPVPTSQGVHIILPPLTNCSHHAPEPLITPSHLLSFSPAFPPVAEKQPISFCFQALCCPFNRKIRKRKENRNLPPIAGTASNFSLLPLDFEGVARRRAVDGNTNGNTNMQGQTKPGITSMQVPFHLILWKCSRMAFPSSCFFSFSPVRTFYVWLHRNEVTHHKKMGRKTYESLMVLSSLLPCHIRTRTDSSISQSLLFYSSLVFLLLQVDVLPRARLQVNNKFAELGFKFQDQESARCDRNRIC